MVLPTTSSKTIVLITGTKTGIGRALLASYALRPNTIAIAAIRDGPHSTPGESLGKLPVGEGSKIIVAKYDAADPKTAKEMAELLQNRHDIVKLDIVIANAGILKHYGPVAEVEPGVLREHFDINTIAPILLYQATRGLLGETEGIPRFFIISSTLGSNVFQDDWDTPFLAYGMSKAAVNYAAGKIHREEGRLAAVLVHPGWVQTGMGEQAAHYTGGSAKDVPTTIEESVSGMMKLFDKATKEEHSGKFFDREGGIVPW